MISTILLKEKEKLQMILYCPRNKKTKNSFFKKLEYLTENDKNIQFSKDLQVDISQLETELEKIQNDNQTEKIQLEYDKTKNWVDFNEKKKLLQTKKRELKKKLKSTETKLNLKISRYQNNQFHINFLKESNKELFSQN